jgi:hypothetical protein
LVVDRLVRERLVAAANALRNAIGAAAWPLEHARSERNLAVARHRLGPRPFERAWREGSVMTVEQATAYALDRPAPGEGAEPVSARA